MCEGPIVATFPAAARGSVDGWEARRPSAVSRVALGIGLVTSSASPNLQHTLRKASGGCREQISRERSCYEGTIWVQLANANGYVYTGMRMSKLSQTRQITRNDDFASISCVRVIVLIRSDPISMFDNLKTHVVLAPHIFLAHHISTGG